MTPAEPSGLFNSFLSLSVTKFNRVAKTMKVLIYTLTFHKVFDYNSEKLLNDQFGELSRTAFTQIILEQCNSHTCLVTRQLKLNISNCKM